MLGSNGGLELIDGNGTVLASTASPRPRTLFRDPPGSTEYGTGATGLMPSFSASRDRLYYLNGDSEVWTLAPGAKARLVKRLPVGRFEQAGFAVSPDDKTMAVAIIEYGVTPHRLRVYTEDLADGAGHREVLTSTREYEWPVGFLGTNLVMAIGPASSQSGSADPYNAQYGYDLLSATGSRLRAFCTAPKGSALAYGTAFGPLEPDGAVCTTTVGHAFEGWDGTTKAMPDQACGGRVAFSFSPDRTLVLCGDAPNPTATTFSYAVVSAAGRKLVQHPLSPGGYSPYAWMDDDHAIVDGNLLDIGHDSAIPLPAHAAFVAVVPGDVH